MGGSLYDVLLEYDEDASRVDRILSKSDIYLGNERMLEIGSDLKKSGQEIQREMLRRNEANPVLSDAIKGNMSVEESLTELSKVNQGWSRVLPRIRNTAHNARLEKLGELIPTPYQLETGGFALFHNMFSGSVFGGMTIFLANELMKRYLIGGGSSIQIEEAKHMFNAMTLGYSLMLVPLSGIAIQSLGRGGKLPVNEARYIDSKVKEFYS